MIHKRSTALGVSKSNLLEGLNLFHGANLTLSSDVDQDTQVLGLHERPLTYHIDESSPRTYKSRYKKEVRTQIWHLEATTNEKTNINRTKPLM